MGVSVEPFISSWFMNQTSRVIYSLSSTHLFNELNFQLKFDSFGSWIKFNESTNESSLELFSTYSRSNSKFTLH